MAITGHQGEEVVTKGLRIIYGIAPFKVLAVNPSMDELISIGVNAQKEPDYVGDKARIEFWLQTCLNKEPKSGGSEKSLDELGIEKQMVLKLTIFVSDALKGKADGSTTVWINNFGNVSSTPAGETPSASWWKPAGQRVAREGEIELIKFLRSWVNAGSRDEVFIDDWDALLKGNVKELREIIKLYKDNIVRSMIEVRISKEGKMYSGIYDSHHEPWNIVGISNWVKEIKGNQKRNRFLSLELKEFVQGDIVPTDDPTPTTEEKSSWA